MATQKQVRERDYTFMQDSYDKITQLHYNSREEKKWGFCVLEWRRWGVYIVMMEEIWMECHLMRVDKES